MQFLASPFDVERVSWLEELGVKRYKIASRSISDNDLLSAVIETGKPIIASLGMWDSDNFPQIEAQEISFLYCISKYPALLTDLKLGDVDFNKKSPWIADDPRAFLMPVILHVFPNGKGASGWTILFDERLTVCEAFGTVCEFLNEALAPLGNFICPVGVRR